VAARYRPVPRQLSGRSWLVAARYRPVPRQLSGRSWLVAARSSWVHPRAPWPGLSHLPGSRVVMPGSWAALVPLPPRCPVPGCLAAPWRALPGSGGSCAPWPGGWGSWLTPAPAARLQPGQGPGI